MNWSLTLSADGLKTIFDSKIFNSRQLFKISHASSQWSITHPLIPPHYLHSPHPSFPSALSSVTLSKSVSHCPPKKCSVIISFPSYTYYIPSLQEPNQPSLTDFPVFQNLIADHYNPTVYKCIQLQWVFHISLKLPCNKTLIWNYSTPQKSHGHPCQLTPG